MANYLGFDIGNATLTTYDDDGFLGVQIDAFGEDQSGVVPYELHSPHGLLTRCHDPSDKGSCQVLYAMEAGRGHAWIQSDPRVIPLVPPIKKGGFCAYGGKINAPAFHYIDGDTNSQTFYVPYDIDANGTAQKSMTIEMNVDESGKEALSLVHGTGAAISLITDGGSTSVIMKNAKGDAYVEVNDSGIVLNGSVTVQGGFNAGGPGTAQELVLAAPLIAVLTQLIGVLTPIVGLTGAGAPAASILGELAGIKTLMTKGA